jgi:methionine synthase II (cobalamin-independent)
LISIIKSSINLLMRSVKISGFTLVPEGTVTVPIAKMLTTTNCTYVHYFLEWAYYLFKNRLPTLFQMNAGYFLLQMSTETDKSRVYQLCSKYSRPDQVIFIGVTNPLNPQIETPEQVRDALLEAAKYIPVERLGSTDDCGFSPFSIDMKPQHDGGPDVARSVAFKKIAARVEGTKLAEKALGV